MRKRGTPPAPDGGRCTEHAGAQRPRPANEPLTSASLALSLSPQLRRRAFQLFCRAPLLMEILILHKCIFPPLKKNQKIILKAAGRRQRAAAQGPRWRSRLHRHPLPSGPGTPRHRRAVFPPSLTRLSKADGARDRPCSEDAPAKGERAGRVWLRS